MSREFKRWWNEYDKLFAWLNAEATNYEMIAGEDNIDEAYNIAMADIKGSESPDQVLHQFADEYYWYDLETDNCSVEAERMGHCGGDSRGTLMSLRKAMPEDAEAALSVSDRRRLGISDSLSQCLGVRANARFTKLKGTVMMLPMNSFGNTSTGLSRMKRCITWRKPANTQAITTDSKP